MLSPTYELATALCHTDEIVTPTYEIGELWLCHTDEMLSPTYEITTALSHTDELISPPYDIAIVIISYGRVTMSSVWDSMMSKKNMGWPFYAAVGITLSVCPSVDIIVSALYLQQYSSDPFHICTSYQATWEGVSRVMPVSKLKNLKFWRIF